MDLRPILKDRASIAASRGKSSEFINSLQQVSNGGWKVINYSYCDCVMMVEVFTQRNFVADFIRLKLNFVSIKKSLFEPPCGRPRDNVRTPPIARWKAHGRLPTRHN